jgi:hypothetical protein
VCIVDIVKRNDVVGQFREDLRSLTVKSVGIKKE